MFFYVIIDKDLRSKMDKKIVKIHTEYITLGQFLKITDLIQSGGEAKFAVKSLRIFVNNEREDRRGRKLYHNDVLKVEGKVYRIECESAI